MAPSPEMYDAVKAAAKMQQGAWLRHLLLPTAAITLLAVWLWAQPYAWSSGGSRPLFVRMGASSSSSAGMENGWPTAGNSIHVLCTSNGRPYTNYQTLVLYGTFLLSQTMPAGGRRMAAFTRILHRTRHDALSEVVPTFRANPLHPACDVRCDYVIADRPNAVRQFLDAAQAQPSMIQAPWLLLIETDFVIVKPVPAPPAESAAPAVAFPYGYISPPNFPVVMRKLYPEHLGPLQAIPSTGPSPVLARAGEWLRVTPRWEAVTAQVEADAKAKKALGWVREMYAFSVACALERLKLDLKPPPNNTLMIQPPAHAKLGKSAQMHYTWVPWFKWPNGTTVWKWDKRDYQQQEHEDKLPKLPPLPPYDPSWRYVRTFDKVPSAVPLTRELYNVVALLVSTMNRGIDAVGGPSWKDVLRIRTGMGAGSGSSAAGGGGGGAEPG